jgi:hypothetical protein
MAAMPAAVSIVVLPVVTTVPVTAVVAIFEVLAEVTLAGLGRRIAGRRADISSRFLSTLPVTMADSSRAVRRRAHPRCVRQP